MQEESNAYAAQFFKLTNLKTFPEIAFNKLNPNDTSGSEIESSLNFLKNYIFKDTVKTIALVDSLKKDTLKNNFKDIFKNENKKESNDNMIVRVLKSFLPKGYENLFMYGAVFILIIIILIVFAYFRWRKQQLINTKRVSKNKFQKEFNSAQGSKAPASYAAKTYKKAGDLGKPAAEANSKAQEKPIRTVLPKITPGTISLEAQIDKIADKIEEANKTLSKQNSVHDVDDDLNRKIKEIQSPISAKIELALHLQEEQSKIKLKNIELLNTGELPSDKKEIDEFAKKLGLEKGSIEIKSFIAKTEKNKNNLEMLEEKFKLILNKE